MKNRYLIGLAVIILSGLGMATVWGTSSSRVGVSVSQEEGVNVVKLNDASLYMPSSPADRVKAGVGENIWKVVPPEGIDMVNLTISYHSGDWLINRPLFKFSLSGGGVDTETYLSPSIGEQTLFLQPQNTFYVTLDNVSWSPRPSAEPVPIMLVLSAEQSSETATITLPPYQNEPPAADFSYTPSSPTAGDAVQFTDESSDPDGTVTSRFWDFGDGSTGSGETPVHSYSSSGTYTVTLEVSDDDGVIDSVSKEITVTSEVNEPPVADADGPYTVAGRGTVELDGTGSNDPDGSIESYSWEIIDDPTGEAYLTESNTATPVFHAPDAETDTDVTVKLTVVDEEGATDTDTSAVTIQSVLLPIVTTENATKISAKKATLNMSYDFKDYESGEVRFLWREVGGSWNATEWVTRSGSGTYSEEIRELSKDTEHEFYTQIRFDESKRDGNTLTFITKGK